MPYSIVYFMHRLFLHLYTLQYAPHQKSSFHLSPYSWPHLFILPSLQLTSHMVAINLFSVSMPLFNLLIYFSQYSTYELNHTVFVFLHMTYLTYIIPTLKIHPCYHKWHYTIFVWISSIPLCVYLCVCVCVCVCVYVWVASSYHSSVDGNTLYLGRNSR